MIAMREILVDLLLNALLQIGLFSVAAASLSRLIAKVTARYQYVAYLTVFLACLAVPILNTFWKSSPVVVAGHFEQQTASQAAHHGFWSWQGLSAQSEHFVLGQSGQDWVLGLWGMLILYQFVRLGRGFYRAYWIRSSASGLPAVVAKTVSDLIDPSYQISFYISTSIPVPVTIGVFRPLILLPRRIVPQLDEQELRAVVAHEYAHVRRRDFPVHLFCELISLPVRWHPGICYLVSKISQTRELACDDDAAVRLGRRRPYANALLRLASLCLPAARSSAAELGIFDGDNLEDRIMNLTKKRTSLSRARAIGLILAASIAFGGSAVLARSMSLQASSKASISAEKFAGTWHWMFHKKSFATMILAWDGSRITGSVTESRIALNDDGSLSMADPGESDVPSPINNAKLEGSALHVTVKDGDESFEFLVTLKDETHAEVRPVGAPANMKPIPAEKVQ